MRIDKQAVNRMIFHTLSGDFVVGDKYKQLLKDMGGQSSAAAGASAAGGALLPTPYVARRGVAWRGARGVAWQGGGVRAACSLPAAGSCDGVCVNNTCVVLHHAHVARGGRRSTATVPLQAAHRPQKWLPWRWPPVQRPRPPVRRLPPRLRQ